MEWVLQMIDELDDVIGAMRQGWLGLHAQIELLLGGAAAVAALTTALVMGENVMAVLAGLLLLGTAISLKARGPHPEIH